ncbi:Arsenical resistance operon trans-acting repressor ArsD [Roseimaritima multifibrata]|uniref:Arsenite methyltransferase n=1 Tax=Roseimaritima multifibrata TaxID=1930274 RepID=A0A517MM23_9BACT|nr:arsenite efflux transporter metallochaperone ArsD [Roseimaritima multifibrata]QDS95909.1 Arsenical resistance operon trans-acting repressor ArsD [Roseimaritima multifibrata]
MSKSPETNDVREQYASVARSQLSNDSNAVRSIAKAFGYSEEDIQSLPTQANMGVSCGNPLALAGVREGEVIVDLGCGGGMDVFLAARKVGDQGKVIGIDMTEEMLARAQAGATQLGLTNVEFHQATIDQLPLEDNSVDCVISNCVINLVPDKGAVFREIMRVLKPGGRVAISDIGLKQPLPEAIKESFEAYVGCISGAILMDAYRQQLEEAGFDAVTVTDTGADLNAYAHAADGGDCCGSPDSCSSDNSLHDGLANVMKSFDANQFAASVRVHATKAGGAPAAATLQPSQSARRVVEIYDRAMCCSTGVCGPQVDPELPKFAADLDWLKEQGHDVSRFNLAQNPAEFAKQPIVNQMLAEQGVDCLPLVIVDGVIVSRSEYPSRENLALWTGTPLKTKSALPMADGGCCGGSGCC